MRFELILPGLCWPVGPTTHPARGLSLPALATLAGFASSSWAPRSNLDICLAQRFGQPPDSALAALRRLGEEPPPEAGGHWLCCDPVHLHFSRDTLLLADASGLAISRAEANTLIAGLNDMFADIGRFEAPAPDRWYLHLTEAPRPRFQPLADVNGRPVQLFLPDGDDVSRWARLANELEVWLYNHPVNQAREAAGQRTLNGIWLWGSGTPPARIPSSYHEIQATAPVARGLARLANLEPVAADRHRSPTGPTLAVLDSLQRPVLHHDVAAWKDALLALERDWFAPLLADLRRGHIKHLQITVPGDQHTLEMTIAASGFWKFWRKPRPLDTLLATAPTSQPDAP